MLHFIKIGSGAKVMIGFHGFGREASMFQEYEKMFPEYTIYSISLFYHGSDWSYQDASLDENRWQVMFGDFLKSESIQNFSLLGFSLGGKVALFTFQLFSNQIDRLHLIAPYGIRANIVEWLTQKLPFIYSSLEKYVYHPAPFLNLLGIIRKYKLMNKTLLNITIKQMGSLEKRAKVFHSMQIYASLRLNLKDIKKKMDTSGVPITFYLGRYDQVLTIEALNKYVSGLKNISLHIFPSGHGKLPDIVAQNFSLQQNMIYSHSNNNAEIGRQILDINNFEVERACISP